MDFLYRNLLTLTKLENTYDLQASLYANLSDPTKLEDTRDFQGYLVQNRNLQIRRNRNIPRTSKDLLYGNPLALKKVERKPMTSKGNLSKSISNLTKLDDTHDFQGYFVQESSDPTK